MLKKLLKLALFMVISLSMLKSFADSLYPFSNPKQTLQFNHLLHELRCPVCQNQDLADSNATIAKDLRSIVYRLVEEGKSDAEVTQYLKSRYGDFILFNPSVTYTTWLLWFGPILFVALGIMIFYLTSVKRQKHE